MPQFQARYLIYAALLATAAIYWSGLSGPFVLDDPHNLAPVQRWLDGQASAAEIIFGNGSGLLGRPVSMASFWATVASGGMHPFPFKFGNLLIHLICGLLIWQVVRRLLVHDTRLAPHAPLFSALIAILWLLHPLNVSTVLYAVQRMAQLSTLFVLLTIWMYLAGRQRLASGNLRAAYGYLLAGFPSMMLLALFSKENGALAPALCLVIELAYLKRPDGIRKPLAAFYGIFLAIPVLAGAFLLIIHPDRLLGTYAARSFTLVERLLSQPRALMEYISLILWPRGGQMGVYVDDFVASSGLVSPPATLLAIALIACISLAALYLRKRAPSVFAGWFFYLVAHGMESGIFPLELYFEHRNYLPMVGLLLMAFGLTALLPERVMDRRSSRTAAGLLAAVAVTAIGFVTWGQIQVWRSADGLVIQALQNRPSSLRANLSAATLMLNRGDYASARQVMERFASSTDSQRRLIGTLGKVTIDCLAGQGGDITDLDDAAEIRRDHVELADLQAFAPLSRAVRESRCAPRITPEAVADTLSTILDHTTGQPDRSKPKWLMRTAAMELYIRAGLWEAARTQGELAWQPGADPAVGALLARIHIRLGQKADAISTLNEVETRVQASDATGNREVANLREKIAQMPDGSPSR